VAVTPPFTVIAPVRATVEAVVRLVVPEMVVVPENVSAPVFVPSPSVIVPLSVRALARV
jgi:hypothetical protein